MSSCVSRHADRMAAPPTIPRGFNRSPANTKRTDERQG
jgi:hypothetical protein